MEGLKSGDVIEIARPCDGVDAMIADWIDDKPKAMSGYLVEVTAVGKESFLGYVLTGTGSLLYGDAFWEHAAAYEIQISFAKLSHVKKVGELVEGRYEFSEPDLTNIYTRCQNGVG